MTSPRAQAIRAQNEQIVTFTLVELLTQLVFVAMLLAFVLRDEALADVDGQADRVSELTRALAERDHTILDLRKEVSTLKIRLADQEEMVASLLGTRGMTLPGGTRAISEEEANYYAHLKLMVAAQQAALGQAKAEIVAIKGGKGGNDLPNCAVTSQYLLDIAFLPNGAFAISRSWENGAPAKEVDGLAPLVQAGTVDRSAFLTYARRVQTWGKNQPVPCGFRVTVRRRHTNITMFERQLSTVEQVFYVARR